MTFTKGPVLPSEPIYIYKPKHIQNQLMNQGLRYIDGGFIKNMSQQEILLLCPRSCSCSYQAPLFPSSYILRARLEVIQAASILPKVAEETQRSGWCLKTEAATRKLLRMSSSSRLSKGFEFCSASP
ncbi:uncharacterized protein [Struthio camelus]|uniref:uncharacterized protein n=1 Tax=Struthio camelus TaxID=8801 RepID=UPI00360402E7